MQTLATVTEDTSGLLIGTTDLKLARFIGRRVTVRDIIRDRIGHYMIEDDHIVVTVARELYELAL